MPNEVDVEVRLRTIAEATVTVARRDGTQAVSYRSIAKEIGGSTALISHFLPTRAALLQNALSHLSVRRDRQLRDVATAAAPGQKLLAVATWSCTTDPDDMVFARILIHAVAELAEPAGALQISDSENPSPRETFREAARGDGHPNPVEVADALLLLCRGFTVAAVENADVWTRRRAAAAIDAVLRSHVRI